LSRSSLSPSNHKHLPPYTYNLILCDPTGVGPLTYAFTPQCAPLVPLPKTSSKCSKNRNHNAGTRHDSPIPMSLTNTYSLTLRNATSVDLLTYIPHSKYIQPHSRVPTGVDLPTYASYSQSIPPYSPRPNRRRSPHIHPPHSKYMQPHSRVPTGVDLPIYASYSQSIPLYSPRPNRRRSPHIHPPHSQYIQPLSRVPTGVDLPTYTLPLLFSFPTNTVRGRGCVEFVVIHVCVLTCACVCVSVYAGVPRLSSSLTYEPLNVERTDSFTTPPYTLLSETPTFTPSPQPELRMRNPVGFAVFVPIYVAVRVSRPRQLPCIYYIIIVILHRV